MLKLATLNVRGLRNQTKRQFLFSFLEQQNLDIIALQEVHFSSKDIEKWGNEWEGQSFWHRGGTNTAGVALLFKKNLDCKVEVTDRDFNGSIMCAKITFQDFTFQILNVYGPNQNQNTRRSCNEFYEEAYQMLDPETPTVMCGDFNMVENLDLDRHGGTPKLLHTWGIEALREIKGDFLLTDVWRHKHQQKKEFTWHSPNVGVDIRSRLDRIYAHTDILENVNEVAIVPFSWSDHDMVTMKFSVPGHMNRGPGYWKLNTLLLQDSEYLEWIKSFWHEWRTQKNKFDSLTQWWDSGKRRIQQISIWYARDKNKLRRAQRDEIARKLQSAKSLDDPDPDLIRELSNELKDHDTSQAQKIFIATRLEKIEHDEKPTAYFYNLLKKRQEANNLNEIYVTAPDGTVSVSQDTEDILRQTTSFYKNLYKAENNLHGPSQKELLKHVTKTLSDVDKQSLDQDFTKKEIREALHETQNGKTPGWDGLPYEFYKTFWSLLEEDFFELQNHILNIDEKLSASQQRAFLSLLYKEGDRKDVKNWRPISLLCTDYKILAKTLANRLRQVLASVIHIDQTCSVPGRTIHNNLFLTRDIIRYTNHKRYKGYILTVDQEKAFDRVDRSMLFKVLKKMNFGEKFLNWLNILYADPKVALYVNGHIGETFSTTRGVRQGCPLSAILYVLFIESLGQYIRSNKHIYGLRLPGTTEETKLAQYADDLTFYLAQRTNLDKLFEALNVFEKASGCRIKPTKTQALCLGGAQPKNCASTIQWKNGKGIKVLGITFFTDPLHTANENWRLQCKSLEDYVNFSKHRHLSFRGKVINLNTKALASFWYLGTVIPLPNWYEKHVNKLIFSYLWGEGKREGIKRDTLFLPKSQGGLGIFQPKKQSLALRAKFVQQIVDTTSLAKWTLIARYYIGFQLGGLVPDWNILRNNTYPKPDKDFYPEYYGDVLSLFTKLDIKNVKWTTKYFYESQVALENKTPTAQDKWQRLRALPYKWQTSWQGIWTTHAPGRYQELHFKLMHFAMPTRERLASWLYAVMPIAYCKSCLSRGKQLVETDIHLFFSCTNAYTLWTWAKGIIKKLLPNHPARCFLYSFNIFPDDVPNNIRKLIMTLIQVTLHQVWVNRNSTSLDVPNPDLGESIAMIKWELTHIILSIHKKYCTEHRLPLFRQSFCNNNDLIFLGTDNVVDLRFDDE